MQCLYLSNPLADCMFTDFDGRKKVDAKKFFRMTNRNFGDKDEDRKAFWFEREFASLAVDRSELAVCSRCGEIDSINNLEDGVPHDNTKCREAYIRKYLFKNVPWKVRCFPRRYVRTLFRIARRGHKAMFNDYRSMMMTGRPFLSKYYSYIIQAFKLKIYDSVDPPPFVWEARVMKALNNYNKV